MNSKSIITAVEQSQTSGDVRGGSGAGLEVDDNPFAPFDARMEDLVWWEHEESLLVGDDERRPSTLVEIVLDGLSIQSEEVDPSSVSLRRAQVISSPGMSESPQFD